MKPSMLLKKAACFAPPLVARRKRTANGLMLGLEYATGGAMMVNGRESS